MRRTKEDAEKTRLKVIEAALEQFSKTGYSRTTLAMIAAAAGVSRGPIYWHFKNKDELYEAVLHYSQEPLEQLVARSLALAATPHAAIHYLISHWFKLLIENRWHRQSFEILLNKTELTAEVAGTLRRERQLTHAIVKCLTQHIEALCPDAAAPAATRAVLLYSALMGITQTWLTDPKLFSLKNNAEAFTQHLMQLLPVPVPT